MRKSYKVLCCGLTLTALISSTVLAAHATGEVAFSDLSGHWAEKAILSMCEGTNPLFKGVGTDEDGFALFAPEKEMTGGEFVTVLVRAYYGEEFANEPAVGSWYTPAWTIAERHGLVSKEDAVYQQIAIPRKVMAKIIVETMQMNGEELGPTVLGSNIADYEVIETGYRNFVRWVYAKGIITGTDQQGTFSPDLTVSRAQGATILNRLINPDERVTLTYKLIENPFATTTPEGWHITPEGWLVYHPDMHKPADTLQTWVEGERHTVPQAGDTVIKADGTKVVLSINQVGNSTLYLLGWGQGVDIITGTQTNPYSAHLKKVGDIAWSGWCDDLTCFYKFDVTGEVYTAHQWYDIRSALQPDKNTIKGTYDGEKYGDYFTWDSFLGEWIFNVRVH